MSALLSPMRNLILAASLLGLGSSQNVVDLSYTGWTLQNLGLNISVPASLPSQAHLDLYANQVIGDPYWALNDFNLRWVAWSNWTYVSAPLSGLSSNASSTWLLFDGLDTFTSIELCGQFVASTDNQFRQYWFDVTDIVSSCSQPVLSINFGSAPNIANNIANLPGQETWPSGVEQVYEFPNRQFIRKEQSDFGWDWGPAFAPAGPWKPAYVIQVSPSEVYVRNVLVDIYKQGQLNNLPPDQSQPWVVNASLDYLGTLPSDAVMTYTLTDAQGQRVCSGMLSDVTVGEGVVTGSTIVPLGQVSEWWPNGMGPQTLYNLTVGVESCYSQPITSVTRQVGFRTIVLNMGPITAAQTAAGIACGNNWHFEINGHEFYAKGSNFIPPDAFWPRVNETRIQQLFDSVVAGNQNMLRVWASGAYSPDFMYSLADELGILLWSEFEFGDALYPADQSFLDNVREEAIYNVRRVNYHPSLALWAGGNELESLELQLVNNSAPSEYPLYKAQYEQLFLDTLLPVVYGNSRSISYTPSSTSNGYAVLNFSLPIPMIERYEDVNPACVYGDTDHYNYDASVAFNDSVFPLGRFANEFGFLSMPSLQTWEQAVPSSDLSFNSSVVFLRDRHSPPGGLNISNYDASAQGQYAMTSAVELWYPQPNKTNSVANFSAWCHTTQIFQADHYKAQIMYYRWQSGQPERNLGSLYWQLEDIWQAPTWAGIEYDGRWKVLHYTAQDIYQNVIITPFYNGTTGTLSVWVTSDLWSPASGTFNLAWYDWSGNALNTSTPSTGTFEVGALNTTLLYEADLSSVLGSYDPNNAVLVMSSSAQGSLPNMNQTLTFNHGNWFHVNTLADAQLVDPGLQLTYNSTTGNFTVTATTGVSAYTWLDNPAGTLLNFDSNSFLLLPGQSREVGYTLKSDTTGGAWVNGVTVQSLWNNTVPY